MSPVIPGVAIEDALHEIAADCADTHIPGMHSCQSQCPPPPPSDRLSPVMSPDRMFSGSDELELRTATATTILSVAQKGMTCISKAPWVLEVN